MDISSWMTFLSLSALASCVVCQSCEQSHYERCLRQLIDFSDRGDLLFASNEEQLRHECLQAQSALGCLTRYSKRCLTQEERPKFTEAIAGPEKVTLGLCGAEESNLRSRYFESLPCLRNMSEGLMYCKEKYDRNQKDIILVEYEDKTHLQCCSFDGYRRCLRMLLETHEACREGTADVVDEIAIRMGGMFSEDLCTEYFEKCTGASSAGLNLALPLFVLVLASLTSAFLAKFL